jgi:CRP-like cAMP-binding protein
MGIKDFGREADRKGTFHELLLRYHSAFLTQVSQSAACNGLHSIRERCCRWLLMSHDRAEADKLPLTHEFLAIMLGTARPGVTKVLGSLKQSGLIRPMRGSIAILNRKGLEAASCDCYQKVTAEYDRLFAEFPILR